MKTLLKFRPMLLLGMAFSSASASSILELSDDMQLHLLAELEAVYSDNIFLQTTDEVSDRYLVFTPGVELSIASQGAASALFSYKHQITRYRDNRSLEGDYSHLSFNARYDSGVIFANVYATYKELFSNTSDVNLIGDIVERDQSTAGGAVKYEISELTAFKVGLDYLEVDYEKPTYTDYDTLSLPVTFFYRIRPQIDLTGGVRYRETDVKDTGSVSYDSDDMYYFVGAVGELFSPVLHADISVGYQKRDYKMHSLDDPSSMSYDITFIYTGDVKSTIYAGISRDYRTSAVGGGTYTFSNATLGARYMVSNAIGLNAGLSYGESEYQESPRAEDVTVVNLGASYQPNDYLTFEATYEFTDVDGNDKGGASTYSENEFRVSASLRY